MLVSHRRAFIYLKTIKTAGTSVEIYFERECVDDPEHHHEVAATPEIGSKNGIVGARQPFAEQRWHYYNHMPARRLAELLGADRPPPSGPVAMLV